MSSSIDFLVDKKIVGESGYDDGRGMDATDHGGGKNESTIFWQVLLMGPS